MLSDRRITETGVSFAYPWYPASRWEGVVVVEPPGDRGESAVCLGLPVTAFRAWVAVVSGSPRAVVEADRKVFFFPDSYSALNMENASGQRLITHPFQQENFAR